MAVLVTAIHVLLVEAHRKEDVDARDRRGETLNACSRENIG